MRAALKKKKQPKLWRYNCQGLFRSLKFTGQGTLWFSLYFVNSLRNAINTLDKQGLNPLLPRLVAHVNAFVHHSNRSTSQLRTRDSSYHAPTSRRKESVPSGQWLCSSSPSITVPASPACHWQAGKPPQISCSWILSKSFLG